jgi:hypothetical protein
VKTITDATDVFHRAIWALDSAGWERRADQGWLKLRWGHCARLANLQGGDPAFYSGEVARLIEVSEQCIKACEKDHHRSRWEMQRDFLLGVVRRCLFAANTKVPPRVPRNFLQKLWDKFRAGRPDGMTPEEVSFLADLCAKLHFFSPAAEDFHTDLGVAYYLWQGLRAELKEGITLANLSGPGDNPTVTDIADRIRGVIRALEHGDTDALPRYDRSELHLSEEQHRQKLWEAVVVELSWILRDFEGKARLLA